MQTSQLEVASFVRKPGNKKKWFSTNSNCKIFHIDCEYDLNFVWRWCATCESAIEMRFYWLKISAINVEQIEPHIRALTHLCSRQMSFEMLLILFPPKYKYFKLVSSSTASGKWASKFPLKFNSLSPLYFAVLKHFGSALFVSRLFFKMSLVSGHICNKSCGNCVKPFELMSSTCKLLKRANADDGNVEIKLWFSSTVSMSVNLLIFCKCCKCSSRHSTLNPRRL